MNCCCHNIELPPHTYSDCISRKSDAILLGARARRVRFQAAVTAARGDGGNVGTLCFKRPIWGLWGTFANAPATIYTYVKIGMPTGTLARMAQRLSLENAVDPQNFEPNLALDLEISDLINSKKGTASVSHPCIQMSQLNGW